MDTEKEIQTADQRLPQSVLWAIFEQSAIGMALQSLDGTYLNANSALCRQAGRTRDELRALTWMDVIAPEAIEQARAWQASVRENPYWEGEFEYVHPDGKRVLAYAIVTPVKLDGSDEASFLFAQSFDRRPFRAYQGTPKGAPELTVAILSALDSLGEGVMILDPATQAPLYTNRALTQINGYTLSDLEALPGGLFSTLDPPQAAELRDRLKRRLAGEGVPSNYEVEMNRKDGTRIRIETAVQLVEGDPDLLVAIVRDVTERRRTQEQREHIERMDAVGRMAAGTAHDFNNLLTSILGEAEIILADLDAGPVAWGEIRRGVENIWESAELGARLAKRLLDIGTSRGLKVRTVNVREVIEKMVPVLDRLMSDNASLEMELCEDDCHALLFPDELEQVVLNLVLNASDALSEGGSIKIETKHPPGGGVELVVSDDGPGIAPEIKVNIFEPYFTTKPIGRGTGLGLSVVDAIVTRAHGSIFVDTGPGRGTKFTVRFPTVRSGDSDGT